VSFDDRRPVGEPTDPAVRALLDRYIAGFVNADLNELESALRTDAALEVTGMRTWFSGLATCLPFIQTWALGAPGDWKMIPTLANGQPAAAAYLRGDDDQHHAYGVAVLTTTDRAITRITVFDDPRLVAVAGFSVTYTEPTHHPCSGFSIARSSPSLSVSHSTRHYEEHG
jgi:RNA polymerase sigma-70 factor (ECF subfamily)